MTSSSSPGEMQETPLSKEGRLDRPPDASSISIDKETQEPIKPASLSTYLVNLSSFSLQPRGGPKNADMLQRESSHMARGMEACLP